MNRVLIVGYGIVGRNFAKEIERLKPDIYDKYKHDVNTKKDIKYDFAFICVDTPYINKENICDISEIRNALHDNEAEYYIIKSTVLPNTVKNLVEEFEGKKKIIFSPEFYGNTQHCNNFVFNATILSGYKEWCYPAQQLLQEVYDARHDFLIFDTNVGEMVKYTENAFLGLLTNFCANMKIACDKVDVHWEDVRQGWKAADPRCPVSHTYVYDEKMGYDSHCLNKDIPAIAQYLQIPILLYLIKLNEELKEKSRKLVAQKKERLSEE